MAERNVTLRVEGYDAANVEERVAALLAERASKWFDSEMKELVSAKVDEKMAELTFAKISAEVDRVVADGWHKTDSYGSRIGPKISLADRINEHLFGKPNSYSNTPTRIDKALTDALENALHGPANSHGKRDGGVLQPIIDDAKKRFRELVDATMTARLQETLRESLGLKK